jgi:uncharacterized hydantoinase/oxoprolinase family protein
MTKNKWGGARPGAGRKPVEEPRKPRAFRLTDKEYAQVKKIIKIMKEDKKMRQNIVEEMKEYIQNQIQEHGFKNNQIIIDFAGLAEKEEIRQAAKELGYEVEPGEGEGVFWVYIAE